MANAIFGFGGRLGRLHYFLLSILLGIVLACLTMAIVFHLAGRLAAAEARLPDEPPASMLLIVSVIVMPPFAWFTLALQAKRFRDMGWRPLHVLAGWFAFNVMDTALALLVPALAVADHGGTILGGIVNVVLVGCLLFWPSAAATTIDAGPPAASPPRAPRDAVANVPPKTPPAAGFGRRRSF